MNVFEKASRLKLRIQSTKGSLSSEDLWDLSLTDLNTIAKGLKRQLKQNEEEDFLEDLSVEDTTTKLKFDLVLQILTTKKEELKAQKEKTAKKLEIEKLLALRAKKQDEEMEGLSLEDIDKKIEELTK